MKPATIRDTLPARPQQPHVITLNGGEEIVVRHPDFVFFAAGGEDWFLVQPPPVGLAIVDAASVASIRPPQREAAASA